MKRHVSKIVNYTEPHYLLLVMMSLVNSIEIEVGYTKVMFQGA